MKSVSIKQLLGKLSGAEPDPLAALNSNGSLAESMSVLCSTLLQLKGEASAITIGERILSLYRASAPKEKLAFLQYLHTRLAADPAAVDEAIARYQASRSQLDMQGLARAVEAPRVELLRTLNMAPAGTIALVAMREDLLRFIRAGADLQEVDADLLQLFKSWFNRGFLELRRIDWRTPAMILELLIEYESVHEIQGWPDLRRRLAADRRCFGFFHPVIPDTPLIFVEVALTDGLSDNIAALLNQPPPDGGQDFSTAIFYSINNCLPGLRGVSFGDFLIKQVVENLAAEMPSVKVFATLSPIPGFMKWTRENLDALAFVDAESRELLQRLLVSRDRALLESERLRLMLQRLCAHYLVNAKSRGKPADPVARFHLGNGARLERINWMADTSDNGMEQSAGLMVNYLYDRESLARNHEAYEREDEVARSAEVEKLIPQAD